MDERRFYSDKPTLREILPNLYTVAAGDPTIAIHEDWKADFDVVDLRKWYPHPKEDSNRLNHVAHAVHEALKQGERILLADEHNRERAPGIAALVVILERRCTGTRAVETIRNKIPDAFSDRPAWLRWLESLAPSAVNKRDPLPKPPKEHETVVANAKGKFRVNTQGNQEN